MKSFILAAIVGLSFVGTASADTFTVHGVFGTQYNSAGK